ncbi:MAG TPA: RelA/SpoT domain-containing protein [Solirubrobacterales bacterium]|nr:RelA/SpoT domain-containing protein [Solirubrobacterales bacterium]
MAYSKSQVNRAGAFVARHARLVAEGKQTAEEQREELFGALEVIEWWRGEHAKSLSRVAASLRYYAAEVGKPLVAQRLKRIPTIAGKLGREPGMKLARMGDIGGVRAVVPDQNSAYKVATRLRKNWTITRFSDYVAQPKVDGYRALHLINRHRGRLIEVQLRTPRQDDWANTVEAFSRTFAPGLKFGAGPDFIRNDFASLAKYLADEDQGGEIDSAQRAHIGEIVRRVATFMDEAKDES